MSSFEQDIDTAPSINEDTMNPKISDLNRDYRRIIMWLYCVVDIFLHKNYPGGAGQVSGHPIDFQYLITG